MRKRMIMALCLVLVLLSAVPAMAAGSVSAWLSASNTSVSAGSTVTVTVSAEVDNCGSGGVSISFDSSVFELTDGSCTLSGTDLSYFDTSTQDGAFAFANNKAISGSAFQFTLKVKDSAKGGSHTVSVTFIADGTSVTRNLTISLACDHTYDNGCDDTCNRCGATRSVNHSYDSGKVTKEASCTKEGVKTYTCSSCGATKTETVAKTSHRYDSGKVTTAASCSTDGVKTYTCSGCGTTKTETIAKTAHTWDSGKVTKEATCSKTGEKLYTCSSCRTTKTESTGTLPHDYEVEGYAPATCEVRGEMTFVCADCGASYDDYIEATGHAYDDDCDEDCNTCGKAREVEHNYEDEKWLSDKTGHWMACADCGKAQEPAPHTPGPEATETEDQVCLDCGFVIKAAVAHTHKAAGNFLSDDDKHWFCCACGELMGEGPHHWEDKGIIDGQQTHKCIICSRVKTVPVETTAPTEVTTLPTAPTETAETTEAQPTPVDHVGIPIQWWWLIPAAILALAILGIGIYIIVGLILAFRKPAKFDAKKKK